MNSNRATKFNSERPGSSTRVYEYENSNYESVERKSKIPKMPKRTYSLEGKSCYAVKKANTKNKINAISMIPRPEWKRQCRKILLSNNENHMNHVVNTLEKPEVEGTDQSPVTGPPVLSSQIPSSKSVSALENKLNKNLVIFKNNVLRIPEYWTEAGESVTGILKNAMNIITKQYPTADVESFEKDIENILKTTEAVKQQILSRTENIITKASQIYVDNSEKNPAAPDEELKQITKKISNLKREVNYRKNVFGDLLKYGSEMKEVLEIEKSLRQKTTLKDGQLKDPLLGSERSDTETEGPTKHSDGRKYKSGTENFLWNNKRTENTLQSCGDIARQATKLVLEKDARGEAGPKTPGEEKASQTINTWYDELLSKERDLKYLNKQIMELHHLCKDHISKFKNFNLQIKMKGICNKSQCVPSTKEYHAQSDVRTDLDKSNFACFGKDLESVVMQKGTDLNHKQKLISQQKKLLHVRDELIGMLKTKCNLEEQQRRY